MAGTSLGTAYVQIIPSASGISGSISKVLGGESVSAGKSAGMNIASTIKKVIIASGIGMALKSAITEGAALEQSLGGVETLYKDHANIVIENAKKAWKTAGLSSNEYMEQSTTFAASLLSSLGGNTKAAAKYADMAIIDMADNANKMGTGIESIQNAYQGFAKQNYTMLDNLKLGYGGTKSEMERLLADASKISGQKYDISNLSDVYDAIHIIQGELGITGTTAKEAESTLSGSFASFRSSYKNLLGELTTGGDIEQPMIDLAKSFGTLFFNNLLPALGNIGSGIVQMMYTAGDYMIANKEVIGSKALDLVQSLAINLVKATPKLIIGFLMLFGGVEEVVASAARKLINKIGEKISSAWSNVVTGLKKKVGDLKDAIFSKFPFSLGKIFKIKLPKLSITDGKAPYGWKGKGSMPSFGIKWMAKGGIVDTATLIGAGEAGAEAIVPLDEFWNRLESNGNGGTVTVIMNLDGKTIGQSTVNYINGQTLQFNANPIML